MTLTVLNKDHGPEFIKQPYWPYVRVCKKDIHSYVDGVFEWPCVQWV